MSHSMVGTLFVLIGLMMIHPGLAFIAVGILIIIVAENTAPQPSAKAKKKGKP